MGIKEIPFLEEEIPNKASNNGVLLSQTNQEDSPTMPAMTQIKQIIQLITPAQIPPSRTLPTIKQVMMPISNIGTLIINRDNSQIIGEITTQIQMGII